MSERAPIRVSVGIVPTCSHCHSADGLWNDDRDPNVHCGHCGAELDWGTVVDEDADGLEREPLDGELDPPDTPAAQLVAYQAAAMREALNQLRNWALLDINENAIRSDEPNYKKLVDGIVEITNAALAAPARNCDMGTADEQADRFKAFCYSNRTPGNECSKECPFDDTSAVCYCQARWAQMLFAKARGKEESNG